MFFVSDKEEHKLKKIQSYLTKEPMIAVLLATANWEWTIGRCILFLGHKPNVILRSILSKCYGLEKYKDIWKEELCMTNPNNPRLTQIITNWGTFKEAFNLRHKLIHGRGTCSRSMAVLPIKIILQATTDIYNFARNRGVDLNDRLVVRKNLSYRSK